MSKDLADKYVAEIQQQELQGHMDNERVAMTIRVSPNTKALIERIAEYTNKSANTVASDILYHCSIELGTGIAKGFDMSTEDYKKLVYGTESC